MKKGLLAAYYRGLKKEEELLRTIVHELQHMKQYQKHGVSEVLSNVEFFESEAYEIENAFILKMRQEGKL